MIPTHLLNDPAWKSIEDRIKEFCLQQLDLTNIDDTQTSEAVHAEVKARKIAYNAMSSLMREFGILAKNGISKKERISYK